MAIRIVTAVLGLSAMVILSGCSIGLALRGDKEPDFNSIVVGAPQSQVEAEFGHPVATNDLTSGKQEATYKYTMSDSLYSGRPWVYLILDVFSLGLAEPILTYNELTQGHDEETRIVYGSDKTVLEVHGYRPLLSVAAINAAEAKTPYIGFGGNSW